MFVFALAALLERERRVEAFARARCERYAAIHARASAALHAFEARVAWTHAGESSVRRAWIDRIGDEQRAFLARLQAERREALAALGEASRRRRAIETLLERRLAEYVAKQRRRAEGELEERNRALRGTALQRRCSPGFGYDTRSR